MQAENQFVTVAEGLVAELVLHSGQVKAGPVHRAIDALAMAVGDDRVSAPYGAVITSSKDAPEPLAVWRTYSRAFDRLEEACIGVGSTGSDMIRALKSLDRRGEISLVSTSLESNPRQAILDFAKHRYIDKAFVDDVFLLMSGEKMRQLMNHAASASEHKLVLLMHVSGKGVTSHGRSVVARIVQADEVFAGDDDPVDGATLEWRQAFLKSVPTWTAEEIASQRGHQAKNKSAAASRLVGDGKIFAVNFGGKLRYPQFQFKHGEPRPIIARILHALGDHSTGWERAYFFASPNSYLDDAKPMDRLDEKTAEQMLVQLAARHANPADVF